MNYLYMFLRKSNFGFLILILIYLFTMSSFSFGKCNLSKDLANNIIPELIDCLEEDVVIQQQAVFELHNRGKEAIPNLITNITNSSKIIAGVKHPESSGYSRFKMQSGVLSAYIVELILGKENLTGKRKEDTNFGPLGNIPHNYIFWDGVIVNNKKEVMKDEDLPKIQKYYQDWWEKTKDESIGDLRKRWKNGERILDGKEYQWK